MPRIRSLLPMSAVLIAAAVAWGQDPEAPASPKLPESIERVERETGGRVIQVNPIQRGGREIYRMKVLTPEGRVKVMQDDPRRHRDQPPRSRPPSPPPPPSRANEADQN